MGTHLQTIPTTMQQMYLAFPLTSTSFLVGDLDLLFSSGVPPLGFLSLVIQLLPLPYWYFLRFILLFLGSPAMVKSHFLHFHTLPPGLPGWILFLPFLQFTAWRIIKLYPFWCHLSWPNTSYLPIITGGFQHIPWTFENFPNFLGCQLLCRPGHIPSALPVSNRCKILCAPLVK